MNSVFIDKYKEQALSQLKLVFPNKNLKDLEKIVDKEIEKNYKEKYEVVTADRALNETPTTLLSEMDYLETEKPIITGCGALYHKHADGVKNILLEMVQMLLDERKVYKKKKFEHTNDIDRTLFKMFDNYQLTYKLLNNSFFGAALERNSVFFDPYFGISIMYSGQIVITTALTGFENWIGNFYFDTLNDLFLYVDRIKKENYEINIDLDIVPTRKELFDYLYSKFEGKKVDRNIILDIINNLTDEEVIKVYYKNNFLTFIKNKKIKDILKNIVGRPFLNPNKPSDEIKESLNQLWIACKNYVMYNYINLNRTSFCHNHKRGIVLVVK